MRARFALVPIAAAVMIALTGCASNPAPTPTPTPTKLTVRGGDMGVYWENVIVQRGGTGVDSATVTVNGTTLPNTGSGLDKGHLPSPLSEGDTVTLAVTEGSQKVQASTAVPPKPSFTQPAENQKVDATQPLDVSWTLSSDPEKLAFYLNWTGSSGGSFYPVTPSSRTLKIPANTLQTGVDAYVEVLSYAVAADAFTGDYASDSAMNLRSDTTVNFSTLP